MTIDTRATRAGCSTPTFSASCWEGSSGDLEHSGDLFGPRSVGSGVAHEEIDDSARRGRLKVRTGKGDAYREVPLNSAFRKALDEWFVARADQLAALAGSDGAEAEMPALWLSRSGKRMSSRAVDLVVRRLAAEANLELSAHVLRHTCVTNLVRSGADVVLVAELAGHRRLDTTRR